jgi:hypothetical protein
MLLFQILIATLVLTLYILDNNDPSNEKPAVREVKNEVAGLL